MNKWFLRLTDNIDRLFFSLIASPKKILRIAAAVGVVMLILVVIIPVTYRDSVNYMASVNAMWIHNWRTAFNLTYVPLLFVVSSLFRLLGLNACQCLSLTSSLLAIGMLFLGYRVLAYYMDRKLAAWGSVLFFLTPPVFRVSFAPLTDSARWFGFLLSWWMILLYLERPKFYKLLGIGAAYTVFALVRSEGIVFAGLFSLWFGFELWREQRVRQEGIKWLRIVVAVAIPMAFMAFLISPRLIQIYRETGFPALDTRQTWAIKGVLAHLTPGKTPTVPEVGRDPLVTYNNHDLKFHYSYLYEKDFAKRYWSSFIDGNYRVFWLFTLLGAVLIIRRRKWGYFHTLVCIFTIGNAVAYGLMRSNAGRYFYINTYLLMPFTLCGLAGVWEFCCGLSGRIGKAARFVLVYAAIAAAAAFIVSGMHNILSGEISSYLKIGKLMRSAAAGAETRSGTAHPVYLILGDNFGWGFFCNGNELVYSAQFKMDSRYRVSEILTAGVPTDFCSFAVDPLKDVHKLKPDYLLIDGDNFPTDALKDCSEMLESIPQNISGSVRLYRVKSRLQTK